MTNSGDIALWVAAFALLGGLIQTVLNIWGSLKGKRVEVGQKREDSADAQETILRSDLFKAWEREKSLRETVESERESMKATISALQTKVKEISDGCEVLTRETGILRKRVADLETELHTEQAANVAKQEEIVRLNQDVAKLNRKVASLENGK